MRLLHHTFSWARLSVLVCLLVGHACAFYVPGVAPVEFRKGQSIEVKAVKMTSTLTQLPYSYYSLNLCKPKNGTLNYKSENLGMFFLWVFFLFSLLRVIWLPTL